MNKVPRTVWVLGFVSLCMDLSPELVHGLLPVFMTAVLGAGMVAVGVVEGIAEATASIAKLFSGVLSDRLRRRKPLVVFGYALAAASKPLFPLAGSVPLVLVARFMDRVGKGIRGAPRDALITDVTPAQVRGAAYGLRQALDTVGAVLGPLAAIGLMILLASDIRAVLWVAVGPRRADRRRPGDRRVRVAGGTLRRRRALGRAHGAHAGPALGAGRRCRAGAPARHRVRSVPSRVGGRAARRELSRRVAMERVRRGGQLRCRGGVRRGRAGRIGNIYLCQPDTALASTAATRASRSSSQF